MLDVALTPIRAAARCCRTSYQPIRRGFLDQQDLHIPSKDVAPLDLAKNAYGPEKWGIIVNKPF
jgi:hypothetical protein